MDRSTVLTILNIFVAGLSHAAKNGTFPSWLKIPTGWRAFIVSTLGLVAGVIDLAVNGSDIGKALLTVLATSGSGWIVLAIEAMGSSGDGAAKQAGVAGTTAAVLALVLLPFGSQACHPQFKWPDVAVCGPDAGDLVGVLTQLLFADTGIETVTPAAKAQIEQLASQHGAETVLCIIQQLVKGWTAPGAAPHPQRLAAAKRAQGFLVSTGTKFQ